MDEQLHQACIDGTLTEIPADASQDVRHIIWVFACKYGHIHILTLLLQTGKIEDNFFSVGVVNAILDDRIDAVKFLLTRRKECVIIYDILRATLVKSRADILKLITDTYEIKWILILIEAIKAKHPDMIYFAAKCGKIPSGSVFIKCLDYEAPDAFNYLLKSGAFNISKITYVACMLGRLDAVKLILAFDSTLVKKVMLIACTNGKIEILEYLLQHEPLTQKHLNKGACYAANTGDLEIVNMLLKYGAKHYHAIFEHACHNGHVHIVRDMIDKKYSVCYSKALSLACLGEQYEVVCILLEHLELSTAIDWPDIFQSACCARSELIFDKIVQSAGSCVLDWDDGLKMACCENNLNMVNKIMATTPVPLNLTNGIIYAAMGGNVDIVARMIELGATVFEPAIAVAARYGRFNIISMLTDKSSSVSA